LFPDGSFAQRAPRLATGFLGSADPSGRRPPVDDADFFDQARRATREIPGAEFVAIEDRDHLGMDVAEVDSVSFRRS